MSEIELIEVAYMTISAAERQFEFWMAVTIALVVAAYTAGGRLNFAVRTIIAVLYVLACVLFYLRYDSSVAILQSYMQQLHDMGSSFGSDQIPLMRIIRLIVVLGATTLAVALIVNPRLGGRGSDDS